MKTAGHQEVGYLLRCVKHQPGDGLREPLVEMTELSRHYRMGEHKVVALDRVNLMVAPGELLAVVGASGSGKTTLMNALGCLDTPTSGSYRLRGQAVQGLSDDELSRL